MPEPTCEIWHSKYTKQSRAVHMHMKIAELSFHSATPYTNVYGVNALPSWYFAAAFVQSISTE